MALDINGKWALVTGASRGVGRQISLGLARKGCHLVLQARTTSALEGLIAQCQEMGVQAHAISAELSDQAQVDLLLAECARITEGTPDILYNNAALMTPWRETWTDTPAEDFRMSFEINAITPIRICHYFLPAMIRKGLGRIINVTSGIVDQPQLMAYAASKAALDKFVRDTVPLLKGTGVLMNLLDPGWLRTDLGGPNAPNSVDSVMPGAMVPALLEDEVQGELFRAQEFAA